MLPFPLSLITNRYVIGFLLAVGLLTGGYFYHSHKVSEFEEKVRAQVVEEYAEAARIKQKADAAAAKIAETMNAKSKSGNQKSKEGAVKKIDDLKTVEDLNNAYKEKMECLKQRNCS